MICNYFISNNVRGILTYVKGQEINSGTYSTLPGGGFFYLQFERPYLTALGQNLSPDLLPSIVRHEFFWLFWIALPLLALSFFKGRFFCWYVCPIGLLQDLFPSFRRTRISAINTRFFLFLFGFGFFSLNLLAFWIPGPANRAVTALHARLAVGLVFLLPVLLILLLNLWRKRFWCFKLVLGRDPTG